MKAAYLTDRGVIQVAGEPARSFLNGLVTADMAAVAAGKAVFAALLTPQGKIVVDFFVVQTAEDDGFLLDCPKALCATLADRLNFYKLRAKVTIEDRSQSSGVMAIWDGAPLADGPGFADPRLAALGRRLIVAADRVAESAAEHGATLVDANAYEAHRIGLGVPRGGVDFPYGDTFPHEADMDQLAGVDFGKGCYVGQEVVSRMQHRGTARKRIVAVAYEGFGPEPGAAVMAGGRSIGVAGSSVEGRGLALLRLDQAAAAAAAGEPLTAGGVPLTPHKPAWARFAWPDATTASA